MSRFGAHLAPILGPFWDPFSGPCPKWPKRDFAAIYYTSATSGPPLELKKMTFSRPPFYSLPGGLPILSFYINLWILDRFWGPPGTPFFHFFGIFFRPFFWSIFGPFQRPPSGEATGGGQKPGACVFAILGPQSGFPCRRELILRNPGISIPVREVT